LLLLFWLMRRMSAVPMTTRFLLAPLIANIVSLLLLRPTVSLRAGLGLLLIAAGAGWLLFRPESETNDSLPPLFVSNE
jgi:drug/metabolite transporter (DMT)-like permease